MCRNGINLTQFKLSVHQLKQMVETLNKSFAEWEELLERLGFSALAGELEEAEKLGKSLSTRLDGVIELATEAEASEGDEVTITPI